MKTRTMTIRATMAAITLLMLIQGAQAANPVVTQDNPSIIAILIGLLFPHVH